MKRKFFALVSILLAFTLRPALANPKPNQFNIGPENYVVIGAFSVKKNAIKFTSLANRQVDQHKVNAKYELNTNRNLYYVYVLITPDHEQAIREATRLRNETRYVDAWVYNGTLSKQKDGGVDINPITNEKIDNVKQSDNAETEQQPTAVVTQDKVIAENNIVEAETKDNETQPSAIVEVKADESTTPSSIPDGDEDAKKFFFKIYKGVDNSQIGGDVNILDTQRSKKIGTYKGNEEVRVAIPTGPSKKLSFICDVFGYRKIQRELDLNGTMDDDIAIDENRTIVMPFELVRLQKGDIAIMYNVYFFKDAGVMRPESRYEVNSLLEMLQENPKYKIKIHGHTNGGAAGKILSMGETKNFFSLSGAVEGVGSAKKLSEERAKVIKQYLVESGIEESRMEVKAWGGKQPIHDKHSNRAQENVRVEIEILEN